MSDSLNRTHGPTPLVEARGLTRYFDVGRGRRVHAVDNVSLSVAEREIVGLVGESGSGKSTFGKTLLGLHDKTAGEVLFRGEVLPAKYRAADYQRLAGNMQMIFQDPYSSLNPRMTVGEIVAEGLRLHAGVSNAMARERVAEWLGRVGLQPDHMSRYPHEFSGGQRQRIGIARALILEPDFVVCDEPISALDDGLDFDAKHPYTVVLIGSNPEPDPELERSRPSTAIQGEIPSPVNVPSGCRFANRCPKVMEVCKSVTPQLIKLKDLDREVACHLYD